MSTNLFQGQITIKVKGSTKKFSWTHEFTPSDLSFQDTLIPIFLQGVTIPEKERVHLTKDVRKLLLQVRNLRPISFQDTAVEIKNFIKTNPGKSFKIEAHGIGVFILSQVLKNCKGDFEFTCYEFPFALLEKSFRNRIEKCKKSRFIYSKDTPFAAMTTLLGPKFVWSKSRKSLVA